MRYVFINSLWASVCGHPNWLLNANNPNFSLGNDIFLVSNEYFPNQEYNATFPSCWKSFLLSALRQWYKAALADFRKIWEEPKFTPFENAVTVTRSFEGVPRKHHDRIQRFNSGSFHLDIHSLNPWLIYQIFNSFETDYLDSSSWAARRRSRECLST